MAPCWVSKASFAFSFFPVSPLTKPRQTQVAGAGSLSTVNLLPGRLRQGSPPLVNPGFTGGAAAGVRREADRADRFGPRCAG